MNFTPLLDRFVYWVKSYDIFIYTISENDCQAQFKLKKLAMSFSLGAFEENIAQNCSNWINSQITQITIEGSFLREQR